VAVPPQDHTEYDLVHVRAGPWRADRPRTASLLQLDFEFEGASLDLEAARERRRAVDRHGITALIVPARYRTARTGLDDAMRRATDAARAAGAELRSEPTRFHSDHPMYFTFLVPASEPEGPASSALGGLLVSVDKCDGHIWTEQEMRAYFELIGSR
jgi:hypothetical protein